jgi:hypothetical protein
MDDHTDPDEATRSADETDVDHQPDRLPTDDEAALADEHLANDDPDRRADVAKHEEEMMDIGAHAKGEGAIE